MRRLSLFFALASVSLFSRQIDSSDYSSPPLAEEEEEKNPDPSLVDLERWSDSFVLETRKIEIPGYPTSFNPSLVRWGDSYLLSFRIRNLATGSTNQIGLAWLDADFHLISETKVLKVRGVGQSYPCKQQDPRLILVGGRLYMVFSNSIEGIPRDIRRMYIAELHIEGGEFYIQSPECITRFSGETPQRWEKNWVPFDYEGNLLMAYSLFPHRILRPNLGTGSCETIASTFRELHWKWGALRGGTPALILNDDEYLAFFHSSVLLSTVHSKGRKIQHYFMGAYTFSRSIPFSIIRISPKPIVGKNFYRGPAYRTWKPLRVVLPCGFSIDERFIWVVYGRQDHEIWVAKLDKKGLLDSLVNYDRKG